MACVRYVCLLLNRIEPEYYKVVRSAKGWYLHAIDALTYKRLAWVQRVVQLAQHQFLPLYAPLESAQLDISIYRYVVSRFRQMDHFSESMQVDYALLRIKQQRLLCGMAFRSALFRQYRYKRPFAVDSNYMAVLRFMSHCCGHNCLAERMLVLCSDSRGIDIFAYGDGVWGSVVYIPLTESTSVEMELQSALNANPIVMNDIKARVYWLGGYRADLLHCVARYLPGMICLIDPLHYVRCAQRECFRLRSNTLLFLLGSALWGKI